MYLKELFGVRDSRRSGAPSIPFRLPAPERITSSTFKSSNMSGPGFSQDLRQRQTQSLVLAPQLRHSLKILQVAALDLRSVIQEELQANPTLEELPMDGESVDKPSRD